MGLSKCTCCCYESSCGGTKINIERQKTRVISGRISTELIETQIKDRICIELIQL